MKQGYTWVKFSMLSEREMVQEMLFQQHRASDSMFLFIDFVRVTNCFFYDYEKKRAAEDKSA